MRVVDHVVSADRADQVHLGRATHAGHLRAERLRDLHRERAHAYGRADDQHGLPGLHLPLVTHGLQGGGTGDRNRGGLFESEVRRLRDQLVRLRDRDLGERTALGRTHHLVARLEGRSSLGRIGLLIHSTAGYVDPGWKGNLTLELSNVANLPIALYYGMKIGQISFFRMSSPVDRPYGSPDLGSKYQGQSEPTASAFHRDFANGQNPKATEDAKKS